MTKSRLAVAVIAAVLVVDQLTKVWVKTHMMIGQEISVFGDWFRIHFVENNGMAFGMELGVSWGKIALSVFRIVAVVLIGWYLVKQRNRQVRNIYIVCLSLVWAGAVGNIIDSVFYGKLFSSSLGQVAELLPAEGGYATWLQGKVVDMLYFPLVEGRFPSWSPLWADESFIFFRPVFNVADAAISVGIAMLLLFCRKEMEDLS